MSNLDTSPLENAADGEVSETDTAILPSATTVTKDHLDNAIGELKYGAPFCVCRRYRGGDTNTV